MMYERIKELCKRKGISINSLEKEIGTAKGYMSKIDNLKPSNDRICAIANALGVSQEYLVTGEEKNGYYLNEETAKLAQEMFEDEDMRSLFDMKRNMPPERFKAHIEFMKNLYEHGKGNDM